MSTDQTPAKPSKAAIALGALLGALAGAAAAWMRPLGRRWT